MGTTRNEGRRDCQRLRPASGQWEMVRAAPAAAVRPFVVGGYVGWTESTASVVRRREVPVLAVPVILGFANGFAISSPSSSRPEAGHFTSFLAGPQTGFSLVESQGSTACLQVNLTFDGALRLLAAPMRELAGRVVRVDEAMGAAGSRLVEELGNAADWPQRFDILDGFLAPRLARARGLSAGIAAALGRLAEQHGALAIGDLAGELGVSRKQLIVRFRHEVGLPPKSVARLHRFTAVLRRIGRPGGGLAEAALECGYFDQAHFNREFQEFAGLSPRAYLAERLATSAPAGP